VSCSGKKNWQNDAGRKMSRVMAGAKSSPSAFLAIQSNQHGLLDDLDDLTAIIPGSSADCPSDWTI
jgi:hypothetical protein